MANSGRLEVEIGADVSGLENGISQAERQLRTLESRRDARVRIGADTSELDRRISGVNTRLNELRTSAGTAQTAMRGMTGQVGNGSNALMQFSRIAQDAPYGIIGIGNNLTATAEAFGHLRNQTGSAGGALRAMASSLMGTGGILLGVSLLTTGFTLLAQSGLSVGDIIDKITGNFDEFGASVKKAREEGLKSAGKEVEGLRELVAVAQNETIAKKDRLVAVEKLQSQFPAYYGNLSKEHIMYGDLTKATHEATKALIAKSVAEKLGDKAGEKFIERMAAQKKFNDAKQKIDEFDKKSEKDLLGLKNVSAAQIATIQAKQSNAREKLLSQAEEERQSVIKLENQYSKFGQIIDKLNGQSAPLDQKAVKTKVSQSFNTPQVTGVTSTIIPAPLFDLNGIAVFNGQVDGFGNKLKSLPGVIETSMGQINLAADTGLLELNAALYNFNEQAAEIISGSIVDTFAGIGSAIGNALATGGNLLSALGSTLLSSLGGVLTDMGKMAIQVGVGLLGIKAALKSLNPAVAIAAGVGLIALGSFFSSKSGSIGKSMGSGGGSTSTSSGSTANNSSRVSGGFSGGSSFGGGTVVFEIAGTSLIGVLNNTQARNLRIGGTN